MPNSNVTLRIKYTVLLMMVLSAFNAHAQQTITATPPSFQWQKTSPFPKPIGYVNDFESIIDSTTEKQLTNLIVQHERKTTNQIAIVTVASISPYTDFFPFCVELSNNWGVGVKSKNNGITIIFSKALKKVRITVGKGLENTITDEICMQIVETIMIPAFKADQYAVGLQKGLEAVIRKIEL
jgi:uncharacterized protein